QYRQLVALPQAPEDSWLKLGRLLVQRIRALPSSKRRWDEVEKVLRHAAAIPGLEVPLAVLRAELWMEQGRSQQAQTLLEKTVTAHAGAVEAWMALAYLFRQQGEPERALRLLEEARRRGSNRGELEEAEIALALLQPDQQAKQSLQRLEQEVERLPVEARWHSLARLAAGYVQLGETVEGQRLCRRLFSREPMDLPWCRMLLDLASLGGDAGLLADLTTQLRRLEGEEGMWWRVAEASALLLKARRGDKQAAQAARTRIAGLVRRRPDWPPAALLQASVYERDGQTIEATNAYLRAFRGGQRRKGLAERLVCLLVEQGRLDEADDVIRRVQQQTHPSPQLARLGAEAALHQRDPDRAAALARLAVHSYSSDYQQLIWLGEVLTQAGQPVEAEAALRQAVGQRGDLAETWLALIANLAKLERDGELNETQAQMRGRLPADQLPLALALTAEMLLKWNEADRYYRQALEQMPDDALILQ
ncbi:MAG: tetratricopeptide repeat protein, partial [Gemmataceae bacterium]